MDEYETDDEAAFEDEGAVEAPPELLAEVDEPLRTLIMLDAASRIIPGLPVPPGLPPW